jgi:hypothetical protein
MVAQESLEKHRFSEVGYSKTLERFVNKSKLEVIRELDIRPLEKLNVEHS